MTTEDRQAQSNAQAARLEKVDQELTRLLRQPDISQRLRTAPGKAEWSAMQVLGHMVEMLPYWLAQAHILINADKPPAFGRTLDQPERLAGPERGATSDPDELLNQWHVEVAAAVPAIRKMSVAERSKKGIHTRRGEITVGDMLESFIVAHAEEHLAQIKQALAQTPAPE